VNGKPLIEFKDDEITINKRVFRMRELEDLKGLENLDLDININPKAFSRIYTPGASGAFLGVTTENNKDGAEIKDVTEGSAEDKAGLKEGDIIYKIEDKKIENPSDLSEAVRSRKPNEEVKVYYKRNGKEKTTKAKLLERKDMQTFSMSVPGGGFRSLSVPRGDHWEMNGMPGNNEFAFAMGRPRLGLKIQDLEEGEGVKVLDVADSSAAALAGLKKDDIITSIGNEKVANTDEAREQLAANRDKASYPIKAKRNGSEMNFTIRIPKKLKTANL
jgi:serine protease Do